MNSSQARGNAGWQYTSANESDTEALGVALGDVLEAGTVVALVGNLGAGKTRLVQAVAAAMGVDRQQVCSPTFVLVREYEGRVPLYHIDAYRLHDTDEFLELGADELMQSAGVCLIEWADRVADVLPPDVLWIEIEMTGTTSREFRLSACGRESDAVIVRLRKQFAEG